MTSDFAEMTLSDYLAQGGRLTSPGNVPPRYRAELLKIMATFVDSNLAGAAGFADMINSAPGIKARGAAARIVAEKLANADRVLTLMGEFGADTDRYVRQHPWDTRLERSADIGATRIEHDMRLAVFNYPFTSWADSVVMNLLMGTAVCVQLEELRQVSYQPLAEAFRDILKIEEHHAALAVEGARVLALETAELQPSVDYWMPRVAVSFGIGDAGRLEQLKAMGLRHIENTALKSDWMERMRPILAELGLRTA
ncbi:Phenylacetic acid catabolic protein [Maritimibacter sp. UBA3975]|uniref:Phenylacetic acid catabolic protein n=1 Tax=Maritimibacter sp. UBA3975 TaxID=1946833 RepID=UPI000C0B7D89|nr:Phenylacetic acid catabolic protein [Maritimibacter sp. UBA3975]MAM61578.1 phenylacetic acid catabolic [Maritimibacter sp.]|tara:strand:+ start:2426 stop:3187 length:762 start_codon:yes stop_codon:yes gene_type:complete